jgi:hypothetical protein
VNKHIFCKTNPIGTPQGKNPNSEYNPRAMSNICMVSDISAVIPPVLGISAFNLGFKFFGFFEFGL